MFYKAFICSTYLDFATTGLNPGKIKLAISFFLHCFGIGEGWSGQDLCGTSTARGMGDSVYPVYVYNVVWYTEGSGSGVPLGCDLWKRKRRTRSE